MRNLSLASFKVRRHVPRESLLYLLVIKSNNNNKNITMYNKNINFIITLRMIKIYLDLVICLDG